jgi:hypothetical protein
VISIIGLGMATPSPLWRGRQNLEKRLFLQAIKPALSFVAGNQGPAANFDSSYIPALLKRIESCVAHSVGAAKVSHSVSLRLK